MTIYQILMTKYQRLYTNDQRLLKFTNIKDVRKNSYENFSKLCKTKPIFPIFHLKTMISRKNKPNSNPNKANFGPISRVAKPIQSQTNPNKANNQSSLITNHLEGKPKQTQLKPNALLNKKCDLLQLESGFVLGRLKSPLANQTESVR